MEGDRRMKRGEGEQEIEDEGSGRSSWVKNREGEQGKRYLEKGSHCGVS